MRDNYAKYALIKEQTFNIFEFHHRAALSRLFESDISAKDMSLIKSINKIPNATPSDIVTLTGISASNLSNRLNYLETQKFIVRIKNINDLRSHIISLTPAAIKIIETYERYAAAFIDYVKKHLTLNEKLSFNHFLTNWKKRQEHNSNKVKDNITTSILDDIQNYFLTNETVFFETITLPLTYDDIAFLHEVYLNQLLEQKSLPKLATSLFMPYQTVISRINRFINEGLIIRDKKTLIFRPDLIMIIDHFIMLRIFNYYEVMYGATSKEFDVVHKVFRLLKAYTETTINK